MHFPISKVCPRISLSEDTKMPDTLSSQILLVGCLAINTIVFLEAAYLFLTGFYHFCKFRHSIKEILFFENQKGLGQMIKETALYSLLLVSLYHLVTALLVPSPLKTIHR